MVFAVPVITAVAYLLVDVARGVPLGRAWILFAALLPLATASKSSALPILFGGICLATAASWVIHRRPPRMLLAAVVAALATLAVTRPTLAGGEAGASVQLGAWYTFKPDFGWLTTEKYVPGAPGGLLPQAWWHMPWGTRMALFVLILTMMVSQLGRIAGFAALLHRKTRGDVAAWLLAGMGFAGWAGVLLVNHVSNGEGYFLYSAIPAMSALTAWLLAVAVPARRRVLVVFGGVAAGWITGAWLERAGPGGDRLGHGGISNSNPGGGGRPVWAAHWRYDLLVPMAALVGVVAVGALVWWLARVRWRAALAGAGVAVLVAGAVGLAADTTVRGLQGSVRELSAGRLPTGGTQGRFWVTKAEMRAAQWLARNAPTKDIVATNVHCEGVKTPALQPCINRSFWVSAMTEHAVVIEGWAYQPGTMGRHGEGGLPSYLLPPADPERLQVNDAAFFQPTPERLAELKSKYHVKWLYADSRASGVSPALASLAVERYRAGTVVVYELP
jgi:hypothetical protein